MKVKDVVKKINGARMNKDVKVYLQKGVYAETKREVVSFDFADYYYDERERTVTSIDITKEGMYIYYK